MDVFTPEKRSAVMRAVKGANTGPEMEIRRLVHRMGYRYGLHCKDLPGRPDLVFRRLRKVVFVHGCFWHKHRCPAGRVPATRRQYWAEKLDSNIRRDRRNCAELRKAGWDVLTVWECELRDIESLKGKLRRFLAAK
jgi:DNA mismatch endonuclease (patch repair protein)